MIDAEKCATGSDKQALILKTVLERVTRLHPREIDLSLKRIERLMGELGNPENKLPPVIHVAGTNGKGSTIAFMRSIFEACSYKVHVYTSPHLVEFVERIRIAGDLPDEAALARLMEDIEEINGDKPITYFEFVTATAILAMSRVPADITLLETGLGGRLDATNIVRSPLITVLTPISIDHTKFLGNSLVEIAAEKAAIMKNGRPCVSAIQEPCVERVIHECARDHHVDIYLENRDWAVSSDDLGRLKFESERVQWTMPCPALPGEHQLQNAGLALAAIELSGLTIPSPALSHGMRSVEWPARGQLLKYGPLVDQLPHGWELWLDGAHNDAAAAVLASMIEKWQDTPVYVIAGMMNKRPARSFFRSIVAVADGVVTVSIPNHENSYSAEELATEIKTLGCSNVDFSSTINDALKVVTEICSNPRARIMITGSLYLAGEVLKQNG